MNRLTQASSFEELRENIQAMQDEINAIAPGTVVAGFTNSEMPGTADAPMRRAGRPKDPNAKSVQQIALRPADWAYMALWAIDSYNVADNPSTRLERMISRLRAMAPKGPDSFGYERDPATPPAPRTTPAVAREASARGITKAELINEMYAIYKAQKESGK